MSAAPIHPADINIIQGVYPVKTNPPSGIGIEGFGKVVSVGSKVTNVKVNDNVHVLPSTPGVGMLSLFSIYYQLYH
jgi:trans-2-enoyl-CoA reductase